MKVATYNVNGINGRLSVLLRWLKESSPDVVCLQELKAPDEKFPLAAIESAGYTAVWHGQKSWNGVAVFTKNLEIHEVTRVLPGDTDNMQSRYLEVIINDIVFVCLYLPNGNPAPGIKFDYKLSWFKRFSQRTKKLIDMNIPVVLIGDFNVIPTELDVYKPERWVKDALFRPESRNAFKILLDQGWTDALRKLFPKEKIYTFWDYFRNAYTRDAGLRIDHILLSKKLKKRLVAGGVDKHVRGWEKTSDHAPVWIELSDK